MPKARAPKAPCVLVWLSPQTMVLPGCVAPCSGPMMCTMPRRESCSPIRFTPNSAQFTSSWRTCLAADSSLIGRPPKICAVSVGVEWSIVASVRSSRRTCSLRARRTSNAWGEVTSCVRCRSMYRIAGVSCRLGHDDVPLPHFLEQALRSHSSSGRSFQTAAAGDVSFWSAPRRREDSMALITSMKARTPDSTMSVVTLVPR